jgi:hypothetical protein
VIGFVGANDCAGDSRNSSISSSVSCACVWNTSAMCFANTAAFSLSLFAHLSWVGVSKRKGGDASMGLRGHLNGFEIKLSLTTQSRYIIFE